MIEKVEPGMVPSHHHLAEKVNEVIDATNKLARALEAAGVPPAPEEDDGK